MGGGVTFGRGCAPNPRRSLAGTPAPRAAPAEARCARLAESALFYDADSYSWSVPPGGVLFRSRSRLRTTKATLAGRSASRRMKYGNHSRPNGT